jgi:hypothetical protein
MGHSMVFLAFILRRRSWSSWVKTAAHFAIAIVLLFFSSPSATELREQLKEIYHIITIASLSHSDTSKRKKKKRKKSLDLSPQISNNLATTLRPFPSFPPSHRQVKSSRECDGGGGGVVESQAQRFPHGGKREMQAGQARSPLFLGAARNRTTVGYAKNAKALPKSGTEPGSVCAFPLPWVANQISSHDRVPVG